MRPSRSGRVKSRAVSRAMGCWRDGATACPGALPSPLSFCYSGADQLQESGHLSINHGLQFHELGRGGWC